jgi:hypothetical protein
MKKLEDVASEHPAETFVWLANWLESGNRIELGSKLNWIGLAEVAAGYVSGMYGECSMLETLLWGSIAVTVREALAQGTPSGDGFLYGAMVVRYNLISKYGNYPGDPVCDSKIIVKWFLEHAPMTLGEARRHAKERPADGSDYEFKLLMEQLDMLRFLVKTKRLSPTGKVKKWLDFFASAKEMPRSTG